MEQKRVFALGFFDGVHLGHQAILNRCAELARELGAGAAAITFEQHPQSLFRPDPPALLTALSDRVRLMESCAMEQVYPLAVTREVMSTPWREFLNRLVELGAVGFVCGDDFRFGNRGEGSAQTLQQFCSEEKLACVIVPEQRMDGLRISSSHIRALVEQGQLEQAKRFLGHPHCLTGEVVSGRKLGHRLGFPTANILIPEQVVCPRHGVYACVARVGDQTHWAVTNVGSRPTVNGHQVRTESWLLNFHGDLYGKTITLEFCRFLRPEKRFDSLEELKKAVEQDALHAREYFGK